jgi:hypothetical protein
LVQHAALCFNIRMSVPLSGSSMFDENKQRAGYKSCGGHRAFFFYSLLFCRDLTASSLPPLYPYSLYM